MRKTIHTILCYSLAMLLLLFGVNFDKAETVFYTSNVQTSHLSANIYGSEATLSEVDVDATKIIGTRSESPVWQINKQTNQSKKDIKTFLHVLNVDNISDYYSNSVMVTDVTRAHEQCGKVAVLNYIHDLDGKKRI